MLLLAVVHFFHSIPFHFHKIKLIICEHVRVVCYKIVDVFRHSDDQENPSIDENVLQLSAGHWFESGVHLYRPVH